jgi:hypothetical protein
VTRALDLVQLKAAAARDETLRLPVALPDGTAIGALLLAGSWVLQDDGLLEQVTQWRKRNTRMFLSQFEPTVARTAAYFRDIALARSDRALFFLLDSRGTAVGHMGIANWTPDSAELDNVVRGVGGGHPQLTYFAERRLLDWVFANSPVGTVFARVLSFNWMAQDLHASIGFVPVRKQYLKKMTAGDEISHDPVPAECANVAYWSIVMEIGRSAAATGPAA